MAAGSKWQLAKLRQNFRAISKDVIKIVVLVAIFYTFSISLTFYNKWTLSTENLRFPLSITCIHLIVKFLLSWLIRNVWICWSRSPRVLLDWRTYFKRVFITGLTSSLDIGLSNWSLLFISVALYTMSKSTATVFVLLFAIIFRLEKPRLTTIAVVALIVSGLFLFTYQSTNFDWEGFILVISASFLTGLRWTSVQVLLQKEELGLSHPLDTIFHVQPIMVLTLLPLAAIADGPTIATSAKVFRAAQFSTVLQSSAIVLCAAGLAFCLEFSEFLFVSNTSGLALAIAGVVKYFMLSEFGLPCRGPTGGFIGAFLTIFYEVLTLSLATTLYDDDSLSWANVAGMLVCLLGISLHVAIKIYRLNEGESPTPTESEQSAPLVEWSKARAKEIGSDSEEEIIYSFDRS